MASAAAMGSYSSMNGRMQVTGGAARRLSRANNRRMDHRSARAVTLSDIRAPILCARCPRTIMPSPSISTVNDLFFHVAAAGNPRAVLWQDELGRWRPISSDQMYQRVRALGKTLLDWGAQKGDRIALIGENRWEWAVSDFATLAIGTANVPIYPTLTGDQIAALVQDAGCRIAIVSTRQQYEKLAAVRAKTQLERIVIMDSVGAPAGAIPFSEVIAGADERGSERDPDFDSRARSVAPGDLATLIYTSGTTGEP